MVNGGKRSEGRRSRKRDLRTEVMNGQACLLEGPLSRSPHRTGQTGREAPGSLSTHAAFRKRFRMRDEPTEVPGPVALALDGHTGKGRGLLTGLAEWTTIELPSVRSVVVAVRTSTRSRARQQAAGDPAPRRQPWRSSIMITHVTVNAATVPQGASCTANWRSTQVFGPSPRPKVLSGVQAASKVRICSGMNSGSAGPCECTTR